MIKSSPITNFQLITQFSTKHSTKLGKKSISTPPQKLKAHHLSFFTNQHKPHEISTYCRNCMLFQTNQRENHTNKLKKTEERYSEKETYGLRFSDDGCDGGGGFGEDGRGVDAVKVDVGGEIEARHRFDISLQIRVKVRANLKNRQQKF